MPYSKPVLYVYPKWHNVSFSLIARKHIEYLSRYRLLRVYEIDEIQFPSFVPSTKMDAILHPHFYIMERVIEARRDPLGRFREDYFAWWKSNYRRIIGFDVCDSDRISELAVNIANMADIIAVPSRFCVDVYRRSGVRTRVEWIPHGVDIDWYNMPNVWDTAPPTRLHPALIHLFLWKLKRSKKIILFWLMHSAERKGWPEVREVYERLVAERKDVVLVLKTAFPNPPEYQQVAGLGAINIYGWLDDFDKMALYDLADVTLMFSRGGAFELNCLESIVRGTPCVASDWGPWTEYLPPWLQVKRGKRVQPLPGNRIHVGYGYTVDVEAAVDKLHEILDNIDEYKAKTRQWAMERLIGVYRWDIIAKKIAKIILEPA